MSFMDQLPPGMGNMVFMMPLLYMSNKIDFKDSPENVFYLRVCFYTCQALTLIGCLVMFLKIKGKPNETQVKVPPPAAPAFAQPPTPPATQIMTAQEYDISQLRKIATQVCMTLCIISFLHFKWELTAPLILQSVMTPKSLVGSQLFAHYFMGKDVVRPFPEEPNPLAQLMSPPPAADAAPAPSVTPERAAPKKKKSAKAD